MARNVRDHFNRLNDFLTSFVENVSVFDIVIQEGGAESQDGRGDFTANLFLDQININYPDDRRLPVPHGIRVISLHISVYANVGPDGRLPKLAEACEILMDALYYNPRFGTDNYTDAIVGIWVNSVVFTDSTESVPYATIYLTLEERRRVEPSNE